MIDKLYKICEALDKKFPGGNDPFFIVTRLAEECGEVATEVMHSERRGVKVARYGEPDPAKFAKELQDVMRAVLGLAAYYNLQEALAASVDESYRRVVTEGLVEPLADR
ncbi:MAG: MazG-like family protein [Caldilineaceae bacterium]